MKNKKINKLHSQQQDVMLMIIKRREQILEGFLSLLAVGIINSSSLTKRGGEFPHYRLNNYVSGTI